MGAGVVSDGDDATFSQRICTSITCSTSDRRRSPEIAITAPESLQARQDQTKTCISPPLSKNGRRDALGGVALIGRNGRKCGRSVPLRPSSNSGANSLPHLRRETSHMEPAELGRSTKGKRRETPPADQFRINRATPERDCCTRQRSKPHNQESAQQHAQSEGRTASSASTCGGAQITRPLRRMRQTKP